MTSIQQAERLLYVKRLANAKAVHRDGAMLHDPIEDDPRYKALIESARLDTDKELKDAGQTIGFCHLHWMTLERILLEDYGIIWFSPGKMNPEVLFD